MHGVRLEKDLRAAAPDHHQAIEPVILFEALDVFAHFQDHRPLVFAGLYVRALEAAHVVAIENGFHRLDGAQALFDGVERVLLQHARVCGGIVGVVGEYVPATEDQVVELGEGNKVLDEGRAPFGALAEANGAHLRQRANGLAESGFNGFHAGDNGGGHGAHTRHENAELAAGWFHLVWFVHRYTPV